MCGIVPHWVYLLLERLGTEIKSMHIYLITPLHSVAMECLIQAHLLNVWYQILAGASNLEGFGIYEKGYSQRNLATRGMPFCT